MIPIYIIYVGVQKGSHPNHEENDIELYKIYILYPTICYISRIVFNPPPNKKLKREVKLKTFFELFMYIIIKCL